MRILLWIVFSVMVSALSVTTQAAVILQYHHIDSSTPALTSISPELFAEHMAYLEQAEFAVLPLPELMQRLTDGESMPERVVAITFDDGYTSIKHQALPILEGHSFPFTVFVNPNLVGSDDFLSWQDLHELQNSGATIANHTLDHPHLIRRETSETEQEWSSRIRHQIEQAENAIIERLGSSPGMLAYPYGEYDTRIENLLAELGLLGFAQHSGAFDANVDLQAIPRFAFGGSYGDMTDFTTKANTLAMPITGVAAYDNRNTELRDPLLADGVVRPRLEIELASAALAQSINCYASGQGALEMTRNGNRITTHPNADLPVGRSRINCTAPSGQSGRFYWYSHFFIRKNTDGSWYPEY